MQIAAIDIGTNSLHMILARATADGSFEVVGREKDMVRLGAGGLDGRPLSDGAMAAAMQTLARFKRLADSRHVDEVLAVATSAVREAPNGGDFLAAVTEQTGIQARVITGVEEARLIHRAAMHGIDVGAGPAVVIDIGGGSTEITLGNAAGVQQARSFHLGVIRLADKFAAADPIGDAAERRMVRHIRRELGSYLKGLARAGFSRVIATSGTALSLGGLALGGTRALSDQSLHHRRVPVRALGRVRQRLVGLRLDERLRLPGLDPKRADLSVPGAVLLDVIMRQLGASEFTLCGLSLREGVILDYIRRNQGAIERVQRYPDIRRRSVIDLAQRCHYAAEHAAQVSRLSLAIFDQTQAEHGLDDRAREWLEFAALLHDSGEHISYEDHHRHSYYLIRNGQLRGFEPDEIETMALVARYHRRGVPKKAHPGMDGLDRRHRQLLKWLSAMLRLAESLDRSRAQLVERVRLTRGTHGWRLAASSRSDIELELWAAERHAAPLAEQLGTPLTFIAARPRARTRSRS